MIEPLSQRHQRTPIDRIDPRMRVLATFLFATILITCETTYSFALSGLFAIVCVLLAHLPFRRVFWHLTHFEVLTLIVLITLPFTTVGTPILELFGITVSIEGLSSGLLIIAKSTLILLVCVSLIGRIDAFTLGRILLSFHMPSKLIVLMVLMVRAISFISWDIDRLRRGLAVRNFRMDRSWYSWWHMGLMVGILIGKSVDRTESLDAALRCRGFSGSLHLDDPWSWTRGSLIFTGIVLSFLFFLFIVART